MWNSTKTMILIVQIFIVLLFTVRSKAQYANDTNQFKQIYAAGVKALKEEVQSHPDVNLFFYPDRALLPSGGYVFDFPISSDYRIGILLDPCRYNAYNCCMNVYGSSEYRALLSSGLESERDFKYNVLANETDVSANYFLVYEDGGSISTSDQRSPDDDLVWNSTCISESVPYDICRGRNYAQARSDLRPPCLDNNQSLNAMNSCTDPLTGTTLPRCMQVGFTSNAFIPQCGKHATDQCGTYLEIHVAHGTPYEGETTILSSNKVIPRNVSGYYTMMLPTTYMFNQTKVLCSYTESTLRVGSLAYVLPTAPTCCCPPPYTTDSRVGSFQCPIGAVFSGAFAAAPTTIAEKLSADSLNLNYPFCHIGTNVNEDRMMCSARSVGDHNKHYTRNCTTVTKTNPNTAKSWSSRDMLGLYDGMCEYYDSCTNTLDGKCQFTDSKFTFIGRVGLVTAIDNTLAVPLVWLSFNGGRTSYVFNQQFVKLETGSKSMYEIWWVVRSYSEYTVMKRKGFNVTSPACTFDSTNDRYFPYAIIQNGTTLETSITP